MLDPMEKISSQLVNKFLSNQCTAEEAVMVRMYFETFPDELEKYIPLENLLNDESASELDSNISKKILQQIDKDIIKKSPKIIILRWLKCSAAAVVTGLVILSGVQLFKNTPVPKNKNAIVSNVIDTANNSINLKTVSNNTSQRMLVSLQDGSTVNLYPRSTLQYPQPFSNNKRQLFLLGTAFFKVSKDKTKPFIVTTNGISTTALGTSFTIFAEKNSNDVIVQLFTGKVMISKVNSDKYAFNTTYLLPGEQIKVSKANYVSAISTFNLKVDGNSTKPKQILKLHEDLLNFNQTALSDVFANLEKYYKITITYNNEALVNMKFTGRFGSQEDVVSILNNIALLNGLTVTKTNTGFEIKK